MLEFAEPILIVAMVSHVSIVAGVNNSSSLYRKFHVPLSVD